MTVRFLTGDCRDVLRTLPDESVHCVVTSPPYWGLRDYGTARWEGGDPTCDHNESKPSRTAASVAASGLDGGKASIHLSHQFKGDCLHCGARRVDGQIGLESDFSAYIAIMVDVFREVRRVLRSDGTLWLNLGDSYASTNIIERPLSTSGNRDFRNVPYGSVLKERTNSIARKTLGGLKPKDLCGIPWRVALALQAPYYTGKIKDERDRIWLAAMIDAEGCIFIHKRKAGTSAYSNYTKADGTEVSYTRTQDTYGVGLEVANTSEAVVLRCMEIVGKGSICSQGPEQNGRRKQTIFRWNMRTNECRDIIREVYPYLVAKQQQARLVLGCPSSGEKSAAAHQALIGLHNGVPSDIDFPTPASMYEPGWYLRQDCIWSKANPMPESVTDRCTKSHEYLFLLSKCERYYYDAEAIKEEASENTHSRGLGIGVKNASIDRESGVLNNSDYASKINGHVTSRNKRSVWEIVTVPFSEAHFATFPPALIEPCIKAGTSEKGCCAKCGAPWVRYFDVETRPNAPSCHGKYDGVDKQRTVSGGVSQDKRVRIDRGWSPSCKCDAAVVPCTVLDPFGGAGTTGLVADRLQRNAILIELNPQYVEMARRRILSDAPLFVEAAE